MTYEGHSWDKLQLSEVDRESASATTYFSLLSLVDWQPIDNQATEKMKKTYNGITFKLCTFFTPEYLDFCHHHRIVIYYDLICWVTTAGRASSQFDYSVDVLDFVQWFKFQLLNNSKF